MTHLTDEMRAQGWVEHDGITMPGGKVFVLFRDGVQLKFSMKGEDWNGRWRWWGARTKKDSDIIAYRMEPS